MPSSWESSRSGSVGDGPEAPGTCGVVALPPGVPPFRILHISGTSLVHGRRGDTYVVYHIRVACAGAFPSAWTCYRRYAEFDAVYGRAGQESEIPNFLLGRFPLVSADFWTSDHLSERSRSVNAFPGTRARGTLKLKRR